MNPFKKDHVVTHSGTKYVVRAVDGDWCWLKLHGGGSGSGMIRDCSELEPWEPFRAGYTYESRFRSSRTFDCHFVGNIGAGQDSEKYAAGQINEDDRPLWPTVIMLTDERWREI
jgi:hypothetical protein